MEEKIVQLRRREARSKHLPPEVRAEARVRLSSIYVNRAPLTGLSTEEEKKYIPRVIGVAANHPDFRQQARKFWVELSIDVPSGGTLLNITLDDEGEPLVLEDWVKWKFARAHKLVAKDYEEFQKNMTKKFYIYDPDEETARQYKGIQIKKAAYKEFIKAGRDAKTLRRILRLMDSNVNPDSLSDEQVETRIQVYVENNPEKFYRIATDKDLEIRAQIDEMINAGVLKKIGNHVLYLDETIGETVEEAILWFKEKKNSGTLNEMRAKLSEFGSTVAA